MLWDHNNAFEMDYVYTSAEDNSLRNVQLKMQITDDKSSVGIFSAENISKADLETVLTGIQKEIFNKMKINLLKECDIFLIVNEQTRKIDFAGDSFNTTNNW